jgi:hypothetical protein
MATSGTYNFGNTTADRLLTKAFQRCGISGADLTGEMISSAKLSANLLFCEWVNRSIPLWPIQKTVINMNAGQAYYTLPPATVDIMEITKATLTRQLSGSAYSSAGGIANNAFDGDSSTACTQTAPDGYISYDYGSGEGNSIVYVGIQSNEITDYTLVIEYSYDNTNWITAQNTGLQSYYVGIPVWYVLNAPPYARAWRIRETGGATLNIQEIYFDIPDQSLPMLRISRADYAYRTNKTFQAPPSSFLVDRTVNPTLIVWPTPDTTYNYFVINYMRQIQDLDELNQNIDIPTYFYDAFVNGLSARMAIEYAPEKVDILNAAAEASYSYASNANIEWVPITIQTDYSFK